MHKARESMAWRGDFPVKRKFDVKEFVQESEKTGKWEGSYNSKKKKTVCVVELTDKGKIKRNYAMRIPGISPKSIRRLFDTQNDKSASVRPDRWKEHRPLVKVCQIDQILSDNRANFKSF